MTSVGSQGVPTDPAADPAERAVQALADGLSSAGWRMAPGAVGAPWRFVARTSEFRWRWMATRLHTFVFGIPLRGGEDVPWLDAQLAAAAKYASANKGGLPAGFQTGSAVVLVGLGSGLSPDVRVWAARVHGRQFATMTHPVLGDVSTGELLEPTRPTMGVVYYSHLHEVVSRFVRPVVAQHGGTSGA